MDKQYSIEWAERKQTKTGKAVLDSSLKDETGAIYEKVSIWSDFPNFATLMPGHKVVGKIVTNDKGYKTLYPPSSAAKPQGGASRPKSGAVEAATLTGKSVEKAQDRNEGSYMTAGTARDATMIVTHFYNDLTEKEIEEKLLYWRKKLVDNWYIKPEDPTSKPPF